MPLVAAYLVLTAGVELVRRRAPGLTHRTMSWMLLLDGLFLALALVLTGCGCPRRDGGARDGECGVGAMPGNAGDGDRLVAAADAAPAKREGRDRSVGSNRVAEPGEAPDHPALRRGAGAPERSSKGG